MGGEVRLNSDSEPATLETEDAVRGYVYEDSR
jgi:hypothetical protein